MKEFRITSEKGYYFICKVFFTKQEMHDYYVERCKEWKVKQERLNFDALVSPYEKRNTKDGGALKKDIGEAIFHQGRLGFGLTAHEMLHCAMWHERLIEGNKFARFGRHCGEIEERLAYTLTEYGRQFNDKCHKYNLYQ